jgi:hypothetical protein
LLLVVDHDRIYRGVFIVIRWHVASRNERAWARAGQWEIRGTSDSGKIMAGASAAATNATPRRTLFQGRQPSTRHDLRMQTATGAAK